MIKVQSTDNMVDIINKMNASREPELFLEFPAGHPLLNNYLSLKILKSKAGEKKLTILTHNLASKKIGSPLGIHYSIIKDSEFLKEKSLSQELLKHNYTFFEYFIFTIKQYIKRFFYFFSKKTNIPQLKYNNPYNKVKNSGVIFLMTGLLTSFGMLFFIFYFAVSKTYIDITPEINILSKAINITYQEGGEITSSINSELTSPIKKIEHSITLNYTHKTTGIDYENTQRSSGEVIFINELREEQVFRPNTRLMSQEGIIFETQDWVRIPGRTLNGSGETVLGTTTAQVIARIYDADGAFIGERGNLPKDELFTIPGLKFSQDKIYAKSASDIKGGKDDIQYIISDDDEGNARKILDEMLKKEVMAQLKQKIESDNKLFSSQNEILPIENILTYKNIEIHPVGGKLSVGDKKETFDLTGMITLSTYTYDKTLILKMMRDVISQSLLAGTDKLIMVDENSLKITVVLSKSENPLSIKATTELDIGISYDFDNSDNNYNQRLKTLILGLSNDEGKNILLNDSKIANVKIRNTPFFIKKISTNIDNIILKIVN